MVISNFNNEAIRIESKYVEELLLMGISPTICISGKVNSCSEVFNKCLDVTGTFTIDLTQQINSLLNIVSIEFKNLVTGKVISIPINESLAYILNGCTTTSCTLDDYPDILVPLATKINAFFASNGITSGVTLGVTNTAPNTLELENIPEGFIPSSFTFPDYSSQVIYKLSEDVYVSDSDIYVNPSFFGLSVLMNGVYYFELKASNGIKYSSEENAAFIDVDIKNKVGDRLKDLIMESKSTILDRQNCATFIHLLHYGLVTGSNNYGTNYESLCSAYKELYNLLRITNTTTQVTNGCGC